MTVYLTVYQVNQRRLSLKIDDRRIFLKKQKLVDRRLLFDIV